ncbi:MAG TPA: hypothetical protein VHK88_17590, partial [Aquihabitans sp.]|nr:hypothetical protein [Aquihabitans sp.]
MKHAARTWKLAVATLALVGLVGGSSFVASAQAPPAIDVNTAALCDGPDSFLEVTIINDEPADLGINVVIDGEVVSTDVTVPAEDAYTEYFPFLFDGTASLLEIRTTTDDLVLAATDIVFEDPGCEQVGIDAETACDGTDPVIDLVVINFDEGADVGANVVVNDEVVAAGVTIPADDAIVVTIPFVAAAEVEVLTTTDDLLLGSGTVELDEPDCSVAPTTEPPATTAPPAASGGGTAAPATPV